MEWQIILALVIGIPIVVFPLAYIWYLNIGGIVLAIKHAREKRTAREKFNPEQETVQEMEYNAALSETLKRYPWNK